MNDNVLKIGADVDVPSLKYGLDASADATKEALDQLLVSFQEASTGTARAVSKIADDTKAAAATVSNEWKRAAEASLNYNAALKEVSAASYLARKAGEDDAVATNLLAAAKQKAAAAAVELKDAELALVPPAEEAAAAEGLLAGALREVIGGIISLEIIRRALDNAADFALQMRNLSAITGISAGELAGLHDVLGEMGVQWDSVSVGLSKMAKSQQDAIDGSQKQIVAFQRMGISINELKKLSPEELFFRLADGFNQVGSTAEKNSAAVALFGRGGRALIPVFQLGADRLREFVEEAKKASGVSDENTESAERWHAINEKLSVGLRALAIESLPAVMKIGAVVVATFEGLGVVIMNVVEIVARGVVTILDGLYGLGKVVYDVSTGNFKAMVVDAASATNKIANNWTAGAKTIKDEWAVVAHDVKALWSGADVSIPHVKPQAGGDDAPGGPTNGKQLQDWRQQLQAKKDAEDGFHELSKADEAKFWQDKLDVAKGNAKLYAEVYHLMRDAERASQKESLKAEGDTTRELLAGAKQGSQERVIILTEELSYLKSIGADQTEAAKHLQAELAAATREYADQQGKAAVEVERQKVEATRKGSEERVAAERTLLNELIALGLQETAEYTKQLQRVIEAERQAAQERLKLKELDIEQDRITGVAKVQVARQNVQAEVDLHQINSRQRIALLKDLEDLEYEITKKALEKKLALMLQDPTLSPTQIKALQNQIENLTREHNDKIAALNTQAVKDSQQKYDQMWSHINSGFQSALNGMLTHTQTFAKGMQQMWNSLVTGIIDSIAQMGLKWIEQHILMRAFSAIFHTQEAAQATAGAAEQTAAHIAANVAQATSDAALAAASSLAWWSAVNPLIAPEMAAATYAEGMGFAGLASARNGMVSASEQLAFIHKNEMVLPSSLSLGFQSIIGSLSSSSGGAAPSGGGSTNDRSVSFGDINYSPTYHGGRHSPQQDPNVMARTVKRKISRSLGFNL